VFVEALDLRDLGFEAVDALKRTSVNEAFDTSKIGIAYLVGSDHPRLKFRIPKASTAQIAAFHPHIGKLGVRKISSSAIRVEKGS